MTRDEVFKRFDEEAQLINERSADGIEKYRKGDAVVTVTGADGKPVKGAHVKITQKTHDFKYGANIFMLDEFENQEKNDIYRDVFKKTFNLATVPFYWKDLEPEFGKPRYEIGSPKVYRRPSPDLCLEYCEKNGVTPKAHCLNYDHYTGPWLRGKSVDEVKYGLEQHFAEVAARYKDRIHCWEVINELLCRWGANNPNDITAFYNAPDVLEWSFDTARKYFPDNELIINEASMVWSDQWYMDNRSTYFMQIERALTKGAVIDGIGMQFHQFCAESEYGDRYNEERTFSAKQLYKVMDLYDHFKKPTQVTEVTIPAYHDDAHNEELQARAIENYYKIWFSHKNTEAIVYWNVVDGYAAWAPQGDMKAGENVYYGGLMSYDMREKPALKTIQRMFGETYRTNLELTTDDNGEVSFRGFYGDYEIEAANSDAKCSYTTHLAKGDKNKSEIIFKAD